VKALDRYVIREIIPPFLIALLVFTFILIIPFIIDLAEQLIAKGVPWPTLIRLMVTLLPQALGLTIPMGLLIGILVGFGRLSADREVVVMMACGISPYRLMRPLAILSVVAWAATSWVLLKAMPDANQTFRELTVQIVADRAEGEVRPRVFFEDFPNTVLYVREVPLSGGWQDVLAADTKNPLQPVIFVAQSGRMLVDRQARTIQMVLEQGTRHTTKADDPSAYETLHFDRLVMNLDPDSVFPRTGPARGDRELTIAELRTRVMELEKEGLSAHNQVMEIHKKFSIPVACFVFAVLGLALGANNRKDGKLASFVLGIGVIFVYYVIMFTAQSMTKGHLMPAWLAMWMPDIILGAAGVALLVSRARSADQPIRVPLPRLPGWLLNRMRASSVPAGSAAGGPARGDRVVVVLRFPHVVLPRPNLLDLYVGRTYLRILAVTVVAMLGLFYISTFIDKSDKWFKGQTTFVQLLWFMWWSTPQFMSYIIALAVLLATLITIGLLTKNSELIVMRACGISLYRTALPLVVFAAAASGVLFTLEEHVLAMANRRADQLNHLIKGGSPQTFDVLSRKWVVGRNGEVYHYQFYDPRRQELNGLSLFEFDMNAHTLTRRVFATRAVYQTDVSRSTGQSQWLLENGWWRRFGRGDEVKEYEKFDSAALPLEGADYFVTEVPEPKRMTYGQLSDYIQELKQSGYDVLGYEVELHRKLAFPLVTLVMTFIAVPFAVTTGRRGAMYGVGVGVVLALVYWTMISVFAAFGAAGLIGPALAAWAPNLLFGAAAIYMLLTVRT
jgi:LPS export ABC transporter permease LptG/LPS export ABC transporter permease LptF